MQWVGVGVYTYYTLGTVPNADEAAEPSHISSGFPSDSSSGSGFRFPASGFGLPGFRSLGYVHEIHIQRIHRAQLPTSLLTSGLCTYRCHGTGWSVPFRDDGVGWDGMGWGEFPGNRETIKRAGRRNGGGRAGGDTCGR